MARWRSRGPAEAPSWVRSAAAPPGWPGGFTAWQEAIESWFDQHPEAQAEWVALISRPVWTEGCHVARHRTPRLAVPEQLARFVPSEWAGHEDPVRAWSAACREWLAAGPGRASPSASAVTSWT